MSDIAKKYFWVICGLSFLLVSLASYSFVTDLYFYLEDYGLIYSFQAGIPYEGWPYQGISVIYSPLYRLFSNQPSGYFAANLISYVLLAAMVAFTIRRLTGNKLTAYLSGLIFSSGYVGAQAMFWVMVGFASNVYLILLLGLILLYENYFKKMSVRTSLPLFAIFLVIITLFSHRAHYALIVALLTDFYYMGFKLKGISRNMVWGFVRRVAPLLVFAIFVYTFFPLWFGGKPEGTSYLLGDWQRNFKELIFLRDLGNFLVPSSIQEIIIASFSGTKLRVSADLRLDLYLGQAIGLLWLCFTFGFIVFSKIGSKSKEVLLFLALLTLASYLPFYLFESGFNHPSWHRYMIFAYPFFAALLAFVITETMLLRKGILAKTAGVGILVVIVLMNVSLSRFSEFSQSFIQRSVETNSFFKTLEQQNIQPGKRTLFYFDVANNLKTEAAFGRIYAAGIFPSETAIASFFYQKRDAIKITERYEEFLNAKRMGNYDNFLTFFYDQNNNLVNTTNLLQGKVNLRKDVDINLTENYQTMVSPGKTTGLLEIPADFPSYKPVNVRIKMEAHKALPGSGYFSSAGSLKSIPSEGMEIKRRLLPYIAERELFRSTARVSSNGYEYPGRVEYAIDGNVQTSWLSNKKVWVAGEDEWIQADFPDSYQFSEVRWLSSYKTRMPVSYEYQVSSDNQAWRTIYKATDKKATPNQYVVDRLPEVFSARHFRMIISRASGDFPALTELEILQDHFEVGSTEADLLIKNPLAGIKDQAEVEEILNGLESYLKFKVYPISDKYPNTERNEGVESKLVVDGNDYDYEFILPAGGISLKSLLIQFPEVPLGVTVKGVTLEQVD